jgi:hypothetical protein
MGPAAGSPDADPTAPKATWAVTAQPVVDKNARRVVGRAVFDIA